MSFWRRKPQDAMRDQDPPRSDEPALRVLAETKGLRIGAAVSVGPLRDDPVYRDLVAREFNIVTCENAMKFGPLRPSRDRFAFEEADYVVAFAQEHGLAIRGHTLVWNTMLPAWLREMPVSFDGGVDLLRSHIHTVTHHYRGKLAAWDVVNEAVESDGSWRDTFFLRTFGPDYVAMAFHWAHEGDPEAKLFYNDFSADEVNPKSTAIYGVLRDLLKQDVPVHGVGLQMHLDLWDPPQPRRVADNIRRFNDLGLEVHITEMDVKINDPATEEDLREEARIYREILEVCLEARNCTAFIAWGVTDRYSWVPEHFPGKGSPLLFDREGRPKPAYYAIREALS